MQEFLQTYYLKEEEFLQTYYLKEENLTLVLVPSKNATQETALQLLKECKRPYSVFVSDTIDMKLLIQTFENTKENLSFTLSRRSMNNPNMIKTDERRWTAEEISLLQDLNFNYLKYSGPCGFLIWSDNIEGPVWNESIADPRAVSLSVYRKLNFIDKGFTVEERIRRAKLLNCECGISGSSNLIIHLKNIAYSFVFISGEYVYAENACNYAPENAGVT